MEKELNLDLFNKKIIEVTQKIEKKSILKIAFLVIAFGCAVGFTIGSGVKTVSSIATSLSNINAQSEKETLIKNKKMRDFYISEISAISPEDLSNFNQYLALSQNLYDRRVSLIIDAAMKVDVVYSPLYNNKSYVNYASLGTEMNDILSSYKRNLGHTIQLVNATYTKVNGKSADDIELQDFELFFKYYSNFKASIYTYDKKMDELINDKLYPDQIYNKQYNAKFDLPARAKVLDNEEIKKLNAFKMKK